MARRYIIDYCKLRDWLNDQISEAEAMAGSAALEALEIVPTNDARRDSKDAAERKARKYSAQSSAFDRVKSVIDSSAFREFIDEPDEEKKKTS